MGYNILLIDDSKIIRRSIARSFTHTDLCIENIFEADNGVHGLDVLGSTQIDLILLDINMPIMSGIEFMQQVAEDSELKKIPVIVVSTEGSSIRKEELDKLGIKAYLRKPVTPEYLTETVRRVLEGRN